MKMINKQKVVKRQTKMAETAIRLAPKKVKTSEKSDTSLSIRVFPFIGKHIDYFLILTISIVIALINSKFGKIYMGLDNASPYFGVDIVWFRITQSANILDYGALFFTLPISVLSIFGIPPGVLSHLTIWGTFMLGTVGWYFMFSRFWNVESLVGKSIKAFLFILLILGNLITMWIYQFPIYLFIFAYAGVPWLITFLEDGFIKKIWLLQTIGVICFLVTTFNPIAFCIYLVSSALIAMSRTKFASIGVILNRAFALFILVLVIFQFLILAGGRTTTVISEIGNYFTDQVNNPNQAIVTKDLLSSEIENNSILNVLRFATGWLEISYADDTPVFNFVNLHGKSLLFALIGLIPPGVFFYILITRKEFFGKNIFETIFYLLTVVVCSTYFIQLLSNLPYISSGLRWISSKMWPLLFYFGISLAIKAFIEIKTTLSEINTKRVVYLLAVLLTIYAFPWYTGTLQSKSAAVTLPEEYYELKALGENTTLYVFPKPQKVTFRKYEWGYYGTGFYNYITKARVLDGTGNSAYDVLDYNKFVCNNTTGSIVLSEGNDERTETSCYEKISENKYFELFIVR